MTVFTGTKNNDTMPAAGQDNSGDDTFYGLAGNDTITGGAGADVIDGGSGADTFIINSSSDLVAGEHYIGGDGIDTLVADFGDLGLALIDADVEVLNGFAPTLTSAQFKQFQTLILVEGYLYGGGSVDMTGKTVNASKLTLLDATTFNLAGQTATINIIGSAGNDVITGADGTGAQLNGNNGNDTITGGVGDDILVGGAGKDILNGGVGNDEFDISAQSEIVAGESYAGGTGLDTLKILASGTDIDLSSTVIAADVENLTATTDLGHGVKLTAAQLGNFQSIAAGVVYVTTAGTADLTDAAISLDGTIFRGIRLNGAGNTVNLTGVSTGQEVYATGGTNIVDGSDAADILGGASGIDTLRGGAGDDEIGGAGGKDVLDGGAGDDNFFIQNPNEIVAGESYVGGTGFDTLTVTSAFPEFTYAYNISTLVIGADVEQLDDALRVTAVTLTAAQLDSFTSITGNVPLTLSGTGSANLAGTSIYAAQVFNLSVAGNSLSLVGARSNQAGSPTAFTVNGGGGADTVTGSDGSDFILGGANNDILNGGAGNDILEGGAGKDAIDGGAGDDFLNIGPPSHIVAGESYVGGSGFDSLNLNVSGVAYNLSSLTIGADVESLYGDFGAVSLTATQLDNFKRISLIPTLTLTSAGTASLAGVTIDPAVTFNLNAAGNTLKLGGSLAPSSVRSLHFTVNGGAANDTIYGGDGIGEATAHSTLADDTLNGGGGDDTIFGNAGNDFIYGGIGKDSMYGGNNDDTLIIKAQAEIQSGEIYSGGVGTDTLDIRTAAATDLSTATLGLIETLNSLGKVSLTAGQLGAFATVDTGDVTLTGAGTADLTNATVYTDNFYLNAAGNFLNLTGVATQGYRIYGGAGADRIYGGDIGDLIIGAAGNDILKGGGGSDGFYFPVVANAGVDRILDFSGQTAFDGTPGEGDLIDLVGKTGTFSWIGAAAFDGGGNSQARFNGNGLVQVDLNGNGASDLNFYMTGLTAANQLTANDFSFS